MSGRLAGRTILVVGAGTQPSPEPDAPVGNGRAIAIVAAREGAAVVCADRNGAAAAETAGRITAEGGTATAVEADATDPDACAAMVAEAVAAAPGGTLGGIVQNVGTGRGGGLLHTTPEDWDTTFAINLRSHFLVARAGLEHMAEGSGFVFIGSVAGLQPGSRLPAYDASKAGLIGLSRHVAVEGARRGVRSNVLAPGLIDTPLGRNATRGRPSRGRTPVPLGRQGTAWEVATVAAFLLSDDAAYVTGQVLAVDGGLSLI